ncbi:dermonecrotic toxin domain-containing protein [Enterobacterales bacterium BD_CKDN230030183-1A_HGKHYDSX7]
MPLPQAQQTARQHLKQQANLLVPDCPDMRQMARDVAQSLLAQHHQGTLDPDHVFLNRFHTAQSSPRTFSGWQHYETPYQSLTLPQLVMQRFDVHDQDNADLLSYLTGFYKDGVEKDVFDEHNEVPIAPGEILEAFWALDFSQAFKHKCDAFWQAHADSFRLLAKVNFLGKVFETLDGDDPALAKRALEVAQALTGIETWPPTLEQLNRRVTPASGYRLCTFDIGGHVASDILRVEMADGAQLLYIPGEDHPLHLFPDRQALYWWVLMNTNQADNRARFMTHFPMASHAEKGSDVGLNHLLDLLFFHWGGQYPRILDQRDTTLPGDAFDHLRDSARQRMHDDADFALRSNADLRKQLWIGYLKAFGQTFGPMAGVDWPVTLAVVGAGLAETGLNIDQAITGHTTAERQAGVLGAVFAAIDTLFNATFLLGESPSTLAELGETTEGIPAEKPLPSAEDAPATPAELRTWVPEPFKPIAQPELLNAFEANVILYGEPGTGEMAGIFLQEGKYYAEIDGIPYQVRYIGETRSWVVIDPENPYSFYRNVPIEQSAEGSWQPLARPDLIGEGMPRKLLSLWGRTTAAELPALPATPYEIPSGMRSTLAPAILSSDDRAFSGVFGSMNPSKEEAFVEFRRLRDQLLADTNEYFIDPQLPARPEIPTLPAEASPKQLIASVYERSNGLVIGESHSQTGSKRFLIDNMALLKKQKVRVLYMEHVMTDFHQADLDLFHKTGEMPENLKTYVSAQDIGHATDRANGYTFMQVLTTAQKNGIRIQAIDCLASYRQAWMRSPGPLTRQRMMNFYAHRIIEADQATRGASRWVALVGNSHSNTFEGVPGLSEIEGAIGLRFEDVPAGQPYRIGEDPGLSITQGNATAQRVKGDLRVQAAVRPRPRLGSDLRAQAAVGGRPLSGSDLERALTPPGNFTFKEIDGEMNLIHRSKDGQLKYTPLRRDARYFYIDRPEWPWISGRRLESLGQMKGLLSRRGLTYVEV